MRDFTSKISAREMYALVYDDREIMRLEREIDEATKEYYFISDRFNGPASRNEVVEVEGKRRDLIARKEARIVEIFRERLRRLDKEQLISLLMTGEFPVHVKNVEEAGIKRNASEATKSPRVKVKKSYSFVKNVTAGDASSSETQAITKPASKTRFRKISSSRKKVDPEG